MRYLLIAALALGLAMPSALAQDGDAGLIPEELIGIWAVDGQCDDPASLIAVDETTLAFGEEEGGDAVYWPDDSPSGNGAIHWAEEGNVDNFEYWSDQDILAYNEQGYGMGVEPVLYERCS
jgi:hypothetical protein